MGINGDIMLTGRIFETTYLCHCDINCAIKSKTVYVVFVMCLSCGFFALVTRKKKLSKGE